jgi:GTPase
VGRSEAERDLSVRQQTNILKTKGNMKGRAIGHKPSRDERPSRQRGYEVAGDTAPEHAVLVGLVLPGTTASLALEYIDELDLLAQTAGASVVGRELAKRQKPDPATLVGKGKVAELQSIAEETKADLFIFDEDLSPAQVRNLEEGLGRRVIDRTGLILDIFARRAKTKEAQTQVEVAQLRYLLPRLTGAWQHLERQRGGIGFRGPGETQLETDRRLIRTRIRNLEQELQHIERVRHTQRSGRTGTFRFSLVGYTNVGKSTLMNVLTKAGVYEENLLFATLDSTTRALKLSPRHHALLTDTVGFIRKLPAHLVASFRSTLAEIQDAHCILHVVDLASPSCRDQMTEVERILGELGLSSMAQLIVFNKIDALLDETPLRWAKRDYPAAVFVSAQLGTGIEELLSRMKETMSAQLIEVNVQIGPDDGALLSELYRVGEVLSEISHDGSLELQVRLPEPVAHRLKLLSTRPPQ